MTETKNSVIQNITYDFDDRTMDISDHYLVHHAVMSYLNKNSINVTFPTFDSSHIKFINEDDMINFKLVFGNTVKASFTGFQFILEGI